MMPNLKTRSLVQTKFGADTNVQSELSKTGFIVPIVITVRKIVGRAVNEYCVSDTGGKLRRMFLALTQ